MSNFRSNRKGKPSEGQSRTVALEPKKPTNGRKLTSQRARSRSSFRSICRKVRSDGEVVGA
ncbi:hypothetical protein KFK09_014717 [Dendrobium nobile]|uniref:Uncharacterized protein n=1 Tax=Dendrobium nobile TaxID=94219 RepID=A0A8T3B2V4_DENNO|nr:hypothetical protein KFK09_014717 [Dendrobium nobile]